MKLFAMAALAMAVVATTACSKDDEQAESTGTVVSTTTVSLADGNKALTNAGVKTFSAGDVVAVVYTNTSSELVKTTVTLAEADISNGGKTASITVSMENPKSNGSMKIVYPAAMATDAGAVNYSALANQDGTLASIASSLDLALYEGTLDGTALPASPSLDNPLAVCAFAIKSATGGTDLTSSITMLFIGDGTNSYYLSGLSGLDSIYVAMKPVESSATLVFHAAAGTTTRYEKEISGKTLAAGNMYHIAVGTTQLQQGALFGTFSVSGSKQVHFSQGNLKYNSGTWSFHTNQYDYYGVTGQNMSTDNMDLFFWAGSGKNYGATDSYDATGDAADDVVNWGECGISGTWSTLTGGSGSSAEWYYLFNTRTASTVGATANASYAKAYLFGTTHGVILFPDNYTHPTDVAAPTGINATGNTSWNDNTYNATDWAKMEAAGAVFLPAAGYRPGSKVGSAGDFGVYWSSSADDGNRARSILFDGNSLDAGINGIRSYGRSVRLVCE